MESETIHFLESGLGLSTAEEIERLFLSDEAADSGIVELILSPSQGFRLKIEPHIPLSGITTHDNDQVTGYVQKEISSMHLDFPGYTLSLNYPLTKRDIRYFIDRLYLTRDINPLFSGTDSTGETGLLLEFRVMSRRACYESSGERAGFLNGLVSSIILDAGAAPAIKRDAFALVLRLFTEHQEDVDTAALLYEERLFLEKGVADHERFDKALSRYSMDILMSQRAAPPAGSIIELKKNIRTIDYIIQLIGEG